MVESRWKKWSIICMSEHGKKSVGYNFIEHVPDHNT